MNQKPLPPDEDVRHLAKRFKDLWKPKQNVRPFLRKHAAVFRDLKSEGWSWAGLALAMNKAKITYRTNKPWTDSALMQAFSRAQVELKGHAVRATPSARGNESNVMPLAAAGPEIPCAAASAVPASTPHNTTAPAHPAHEFAYPPPVFDAPHEESEPEFRPVRFIDWDERRRLEREAAANAPAQTPHGAVPTEQPSEHYLAVMESLTGKKPPF